ncbi:MAG: hypothetical protein JNM47_00755 [Hyphomonadaceae bacterium]|nr:hypothetical protein [Hyphomonadaceae bacterium]
MQFGTHARAIALALTLGLAACGGGGIASPGATNSGTPPGGGTGGGGTGGGGTATCPAGTTNAGGLAGNTVCNLTGEILSNLTLANISGVVYRLNGRVDVGRDLGANGAATTGQAATLTIQPGVRIFGAASGDMLIVNRGSRIDAQGTVASPIVFTSQNDISGAATDTTSRQWAGVIINGRAPVGGCATAVTRGSIDCQNQVEGVTASTGTASFYGGATPTDTSGTLRYVRIQYAGAFLPGAAAGDDLNGLTLGGVGSNTTVEYVQVHNSGDDGIEIFGGAVNMRYVVVTGANDDGLDLDEGYAGAIQFAVIRQANIATDGPDRNFEWSNRTVAGTGAPGFYTNPLISNFTAIGRPQNGTGSNLTGLSLNNTSGTPGASGRIYNGVVTGSTTCANFESSSAVNPPVVQSVLFDCPTAAGGAVTTGIINAAGANNSTNVPNSLTNFMPGPAELARPAVNPTTLSPFFQAANYIGAFSPTESASSNWASGWTIGLFAPPAGCPANTVDTNTTVAGLRNCRLSGQLLSNTRLVAGNIYQLQGRVDVGNDTGPNPASPIAGRVNAQLTIDAGVRIYGRAAGDMLIVNRGSQIFANGTTSAPVVMTSENDIVGLGTRSSATREWAGLIINGRAPVGGCTTAVTRGTVDCQNQVEGVTAATGTASLYGGATPGDSSGRLSHLQIKFPGAFLPGAAAGDDLNGLTLGGVGSGTTVEYVQVHNSGDDGIEIFGGAVNLRYVVITGANDDGLDLDEGYAGAIQFAILRQANYTSDGPDRNFEWSNRTVAGTGAPGFFTNPLISNFTAIGRPQNGTGSNLTNLSLNNTSGTPGASGRIYNGVVTTSTTCANFESSSAVTPPVVQSVLFDCPTASGGAVTAGIINAAGANNATATPNTLTSSFINGATENARPFVDPTTLSPFFVAAPYIGAVRNSSDTWWQGWTCGLQSGSTC